MNANALVIDGSDSAFNRRLLYSIGIAVATGLRLQLLANPNSITDAGLLTFHYEEACSALSALQEELEDTLERGRIVE
tara:strand:+ start:441 stop:674 length:234 start_codon:yes stop_codon:yes gene_type:complete